MENQSMVRVLRRVSGVIGCALLATCAKNDILPPSSDRLSVGTWGGENAGMIVDDTLAHVHIGCTYGNFPGPIELDENGRFAVTGSYVLHAYPVAIGPPLPAQIAGVVQGATATVTVAVNDTVQKSVVALGPVTVRFGKDPQLGPCPICVKPPALPARPRSSSSQPARQ